MNAQHTVTAFFLIAFAVLLAVPVLQLLWVWVLRCLSPARRF
jgi:hypothetical protein